MRCHRAPWPLRLLLIGLVLLALPAQAQIQIDAVNTAPPSPLPLGQPVTLTASAQASAAGALEYRWTFGDGTPRTPWSPESSIIHTYQIAGTFTVLVQVRHPTLGLASATLGVAVQAQGQAQVVQSSTIVVHAARRELWLANPDHSQLAVIDLASHALVAEVDVGDTPVALAVDGSGGIWVANRGDDSVQRIDADSRQVVQTLNLRYGAAPAALLLDAHAGRGYVSLSGSGQVLAFDSGSGVIVDVGDVGPRPGAMALNASAGRLYVARTISAADAGQVWTLQLPAMTVTGSVALPLDTTTPDSGSAGRGLPNYVGALALTGTGSELWYAGQKSNIVRGLRRDGQPLSFETALRSLVGHIDTASAQEHIAERIDIDDASRLGALTVLPGDSLVAVALEGRNEVVVIDAGSGAVRARATVGLTPSGLAYDPVDKVLYSRNLLGRSVTALDAAPVMAGVTGVLPVLAEIAGSSAEPLPAPVLLGKIVFHDASDTRMAKDGYFSCSACHVDGGHDGMTWDFSQLGEGLRNTTTLRGRAGMGQGRVHWSGNFDEIQDFEHPIRALFGGLGFLTPQQFAATTPLGTPKAGLNIELDALAAYVASFDAHDRSPWRDADGGLSAQGQAGRQHFIDLQCHLCHAGADFTDSPTGLRHDVGTLGPDSGQRLGRPLHALDTPTLRGLWDSAPYLHDGSADSLHAVLVDANNATGDGAHGNVAALDNVGLQALLAFLLQIDDAEAGMPPAPLLQVTTPADGSEVDAGSSLPLAFDSDLDDIVAVTWRGRDEVIASVDTAPFTATWTIPDAVRGAVEIEAHVYHHGGRFNTLSLPVTITVRAADPVFGNGFE